MSDTVLFVCTGNTCRSPMAECWFRHLASGANLAPVSAGVFATPGAPASELARRLMAEEGLSLARFRSRQLTAEMVEAAVAVVTMTEAHRWGVLSLVPTAAEKTRTLMSYLGVVEDVSDPFGGTIADYRHCLEGMKPAVAAVIESVSGEARWSGHGSGAGAG